MRGLFRTLCHNEKVAVVVMVVCWPNCRKNLISWNFFYFSIVSRSRRLCVMNINNVLQNVPLRVSKQVFEALTICEIFCNTIIIHLHRYPFAWPLFYRQFTRNQKENFLLFCFMTSISFFMKLNIFRCGENNFLHSLKIRALSILLSDMQWCLQSARENLFELE